VHHYGLLCTCIGLQCTVPHPLPWKWIREAMFVAPREPENHDDVNSYNDFFYRCTITQ